MVDTVNIASLPVLGIPERMTRRLAAVVLAGQAPVLVFAATAARGLLGADGVAAADAVLWSGCALAVWCVLGAGLMRRGLGLPMGWIAQIGTLLAALVLPIMGLVGVVFLLLWVVALRQGVKMDRLTAEFVARSGT